MKLWMSLDGGSTHAHKIRAWGVSRNSPVSGKCQTGPPQPIWCQSHGWSKELSGPLVRPPPLLPANTPLMGYASNLFENLTPALMCLPLIRIGEVQDQGPTWPGGWPASTTATWILGEPQGDLRKDAQSFMRSSTIP